MLTKDNVLKTISKFPDSFSLDELVDKLIFMDKVEKGLDQSLSNKVHTHEEAKKRLAISHPRFSPKSRKNCS